MTFRRAHVHYASDEGACLVGNPGADRYVRLAGTALRIWEYLEYPIPLDDLCSRLGADFGLCGGDLHEEVADFIRELAGRGLLETLDRLPRLDEKNRRRYLGTLKRSLANCFYLEHELRIARLLKHGPGDGSKDTIRFLRDIRSRHIQQYESLLSSRTDGKPHPETGYLFPHTLIGLQRLENMERCAEELFAAGIPGDFLEAGAAQGGASVFLRGLQTAYGQETRKTWVADSFRGLPSAVSEEDLRHRASYPEGDNPVVSYDLETVKDLFRRYDLLDDGVCFVPGWFSETLADLPVRHLALLRIDADMYGSTMDALTALYPRVVPGGYVIVDDYGSFPACRAAVDEFRAARSVTAPLKSIDWEGVYWRVAENREDG